MAEDILALEGMESVLTATTPEGGTPTVITVSRLSRFRSGMGKTSCVYGFGAYRRELLPQQVTLDVGGPCCIELWLAGQVGGWHRF